MKGQAAVGETRKAFEAFAARKTRQAQCAAIHPLVTIEDRSSEFPLDAIGTAWTRQFYDGPFHLVPAHSVVAGVSRAAPGTPNPGSRTAGSVLPVISVVFVQSQDGNTGADDPGELGGGETDKHFLYEGLSRVAADAVLAGATTATGDGIFFSVWHPELVALRASLGLPRHPAQVVITRRARLDADASMIFNVPDVPVIVLGSAAACAALAPAAALRPWMHVVPLEGADVRPALRRVQSEFGIQRISCIGGRTIATALLDAALVQDIYLTTTEREGGEPDTPFYVGATPPVLERMVRKRGTDPQAPFVFEHLRVSDSSSRGDPTARR